MKNSELKIIGCMLVLLVCGKVEALDLAAVVSDIRTHHNTPISLEAEPLSNFFSYQVARIYWLPDYTQRFANRMNDAASHFAASCGSYSGYSDSCGSPRINDGQKTIGGLTCFKNCRCPVEYQYKNGNVSGVCSEGNCCQEPYYVSGSSCDELYKICEKDLDRACKSYQKAEECASGWELSSDPKQKCAYSDAYGICCNSCVGYSYDETTNLPEQGYVLDPTQKCTSCTGFKYKRKANSCGAGWSECKAYGPMATARKCYEGTVVLYDSCKTCANECSLSYSDCVSGGSYSCKEEACSGKWCREGCASGYSDFCKAPETNCATLNYTKALGSCAAGLTEIRCPYDVTKVNCF